MFRTIIWFIYFWAYLVGLLPKLNRALKLQHTDMPAADAIGAVEVKKWAASLLKLAGVKVEVTGLENIPTDTPVVFVSNHQGNFDIPIMLACLDKPHSLMAKKETLKIPLIRSWMKVLHCIFVDRGDARQAVASLNEAIANIKAGYSVIIFPEGTRSKGDEMGEFKAGSFRIAAKTGVPIVPLCLNGTYRAMEANGNLICPAAVTLKILPPVPTKGLSKEELKALPEQMRSLIAQNK
ncbi:MAG: lysophospholipid acyltransferase family protein [Oscillospiraceae bacterium]|nr:lysophospholipid acyltransferase family protein [Oscillospiraceae bacterium]